MPTPVPGPRGLPIVGNGLQVPADAPYLYFLRLAEQHPGGIFRVNLAGRHVVMVYDPDLVAEACDESRFYKAVDPPLSYVREFAGDGLFTAHDGEPVWGHAHRILRPAFSQRSMKQYLPQMLSVAGDMIASWNDAASSDEPVDVSRDMTRLALDTIALSGFGHAFKSFEREDLHPVLEAMGRSLNEALVRIKQPAVVTRAKRKAEAAFRADIELMHDMVDEVIRVRRAGEETGEDLLGLMLGATDPMTGERLSDENIRFQVLTFLIAGHETTSGTLSFALNFLLRHPHVLAQAYAEVDRLLPGDTVPTYENIMKLDVIPRVLDETLRLRSPITSIGMLAYEDTLLGGKYEIAKGRKVTILMRPLHTNPKAWERPEEFDIDRWLPDRKAGRHPHAYKPFGNGDRACIGRQFALTEARLALAMVLQRFAISEPDVKPLRIKQVMTIKPEGFMLRVRARQAHERMQVAVSAGPSAEPSAKPERKTVELQASGVPMTVAFGSNLGTSEEMAQQIADRARRSGFAVTVRTLDELADDFPSSGILTVVTSSYNGKAPDNAQRFDSLELPSSAGLSFAVLGNGNTQWTTFQAFPRRVEAALLAAGATPIVPRGETDASGDFDGMATAWLEGFWSALAESFGADAVQDQAGRRYVVEVLGEDQVRPAVVSGNAYPMTVVSTRDLVGDPTGLWDFSRTQPRSGVKAITVRLPEGVTYEAGDHLAVYAKNDPSLVQRALAALRTPGDTVLRLGADRKSALPLGTPITAGLLLSEFVELQEPATRAQLRVLSEHTSCPWTGGQLAAWNDPSAYTADILEKRVSVLSLLERFPAIELPFGVFLELAGTIKPRFYSISSSPSVDPSVAAVTVGLVDGPALAGDGRYRGMCSQYLARLSPGDVFYGHVRVPAPPFRLPADPAVPLILIGPGTGIAPLRAFLQERSQQPGAGQAMLFYGCRHPEHDLLYADELRQWESDGVVELHLAYSAIPDHPHRHVQHALAANGEAVWSLLEKGAHIYLCGDGRRMAPAVRAELMALHTSQTGSDEEQAAAWLRTLEETGRYQQDVYA